MKRRPDWWDPKGIARWDYSGRCPGCKLLICEGDPVHKISLPGKRPVWWHTDCRAEYRKRLNSGAAEDGDVVQGGDDAD